MVEQLVLLQRAVVPCRLVLNRVTVCTVVAGSPLYALPWCVRCNAQGCALLCTNTQLICPQGRMAAEHACGEQGTTKPESARQPRLLLTDMY
jgi:hypothetical protein